MENQNEATTKSKKNIIERYKDSYCKHPIIFNLVYIILTGCTIQWLALIFLDFWTNHGEISTVPDVKGMTIEQASETLATSNLNMQIVDTVYSESATPGQIMDQQPKAGACVKPDGIVYLTINSFNSEPIRIYAPIIGTSELEASSNLKNYGFKNIVVRYVDTEYKDKLVLSATFNGIPIEVGSIIPKNATITLEVGRVPEIEIIDEIPGMSDSNGDVIVETTTDNMFDSF